MTRPTDKPAPRIEIKLGASTARNRYPTPSGGVRPAILGKRPRPKLDDGDSDAEHDHQTLEANGRATSISLSLDELGAGETTATRQPRTIPPQPNRDWRSEANAKRVREGASQPSQSIEVADGDGPLKWGLVERPASSRKPPVVTGGENKRAPPEVKSAETDEAVEATPRTADQEAMDALMGKTPEASRGALVVQGPLHVTEDDAYQRGMGSAPESSTIREYEEMPVEELGAALLRGMGWDGKPRGPRPKEVNRRPNQMGLGARDLKGQEDLGSWNQQARGRSQPRIDGPRRQDRARNDSNLERSPRDSYRTERDRDKREERANVWERRSR